MRRRTLTLCAVAAALSLGGCESRDLLREDVTFRTDELEAIARPPMFARGSSVAEEAMAVSAPEIEIPPPPDQADPRGTKLIRSGRVELEVDSLGPALDAIRQAVESIGGYVAQSQVQGRQGGVRRADLTLRVPSDRFDGLFDGVGQIGRVVSASQSVEDVSRAYFDAETRQRVREETVRRLEYLAASGGDLEDLLSIERELGRAVEQLESLKGQLRYYDLRIAESDLYVTLSEPRPLVQQGVFRPVTLALRDAAESFAASLGALIRFVVFLTPWLLVGILSGIWARRVWRARTAP